MHITRYVVSAHFVEIIVDDMLRRRKSEHFIWISLAHADFKFNRFLFSFSISIFLKFRLRNTLQPSIEQHIRKSDTNEKMGRTYIRTNCKEIQNKINEYGPDEITV